ncbi:MAG: hypothetical protein ACAH80_04310 [Alphaproteobacteria bacterium]
MNASDLRAFLLGDLAAKEFQSLLNKETEAWAKRLSERGRSAPISLLGMYEPIDITPKRALVLLDAYITGDFSAASYAYVLDALLLSEHAIWTDLSVRDAMEYVLGEYYPTKMDRERALQAREEILMEK